MSATRVLALAGIVSAALTALGGAANVPRLIGAAGLVMLAGNIAALVWQR
jgi:hypothetical protein